MNKFDYWQQPWLYFSFHYAFDNLPKEKVLPFHFQSLLRLLIPIQKQLKAHSLMLHYNGRHKMEKKNSKIFFQENYTKQKSFLQCLIHLNQNFLQRLHLLHQHRISNSINTIQTTIILAILKHLCPTQKKIKIHKISNYN